MIDILERARMLQAGIAGLRYEVFQRLDGFAGSAFSFALSGRHTGVLQTPLGPLPPTGRHVEVRGMDIFRIEGDVITGVWAISDVLGLVLQAAAVQLVEDSAGADRAQGARVAARQPV